MFQVEFDGEVITIDPASLVPEEWSQVALELGGFALRTGIEPDVEVKAAAVALVVLRRHPSRAGLSFSALVVAEDVTPAPSPFDGLPPEQQLRLLAEMGA